METVTELIATRDRIAEQLVHIDNGDEDIEEKEKEVAALLAKAEKQAALLTSIRQKSAKAIEKEMKGRLIPLGRDRDRRYKDERNYNDTSGRSFDP